LETKPGLWVLDEPFDALDDGGMDIVHALLQAHLARGGSALITSHIPVGLGPAHLSELDLQKVTQP
jgi:heme exporter protein A